MNPNREIYQLKQRPGPVDYIWNGDCWRAALALRMRDDLDMVVVDVDQGVGVIRRVAGKHIKSTSQDWAMERGLDIIHNISYQEFDEYREVLLTLVTMAEFRMWLEGISLSTIAAMR